jgi:hypothetical protein
MNRFEASITSSQDKVQIAISGHLDEEAVLPEVSTRGRIVISAEFLKLINSAGIRSWCRWVNEFRSEVVLQNCPFILVKHFSTIRGFLPKKTRINSFYVPYLSISGDERKDVLYMRGVDFNDDGSFKIRKLVDSKGDVMEMDVNENTYFSFLSKLVV